MDIWVVEVDDIAKVLGVYTAVVDEHLAVDWNSSCSYVGFPS